MLSPVSAVLLRGSHGIGPRVSTIKLSYPIPLSQNDIGVFWPVYVYMCLYICICIYIYIHTMLLTLRSQLYAYHRSRMSKQPLAVCDMGAINSRDLGNLAVPRRHVVGKPKYLLRPDNLRPGSSRQVAGIWILLTECYINPG